MRSVALAQWLRSRLLIAAASRGCASSGALPSAFSTSSVGARRAGAPSRAQNMLVIDAMHRGGMRP